MISQILTVVSEVLILLGLIGVVKRDIKIKLFFLTINTFGILTLAFAQGEIGLAGTAFAGLWQMVYQLPALFLFMILIQSICKRNGVRGVEELAGIRQGMPYLFAAGAVFAVVLIGLPGTGTCNGYFLTALGLMLGQTGVWRYIGLGGILAGIAVNAAITFSILKSAWLPADDKPKLPPKAGAVYVALALLLILACVFYDYAAIVISGIENIFR